MQMIADKTQPSFKELEFNFPLSELLNNTLSHKLKKGRGKGYIKMEYLR